MQPGDESGDMIDEYLTAVGIIDKDKRAKIRAKHAEQSR